MMPLKSKSFKASTLRALKAVRDRLARRERYVGATNAPQWLFWAMHAKYLNKFERMNELLELASERPLTKSEVGLIKDGLAIGVTNVTPDRVEWTYKWAPKEQRLLAMSLFDPERPIDSVELGVLAATPFDPSSDEYYTRLWTGFEGSLTKDSEAYRWYS